MARFSVLPGMLPRAPVYQAGSSVEDVIMWMVVAIGIILILGLLLYFFIVRSNVERERQMALARVRSGRSAAPLRSGRGADRYAYGRSYDQGSQDIPDAVRAAYQGLETDRQGYGEAGYGESDHSARDETYFMSDEGEATAEAGRVDRPPEAARPRPGTARRPPEPARRPRPADRTASNLEFLEDLLRPDGQKAAPVRLEQEDRQLLWEESQEPETEAPPGDEEVLFVDEEPEEQAPAREPAKDEFASGPLALMLLQKDIEKAVKEGARKPPPEKGPAWSEGRPVFSKPLEAPTSSPPVSASERPAPDMGEFSVQLKSLAEKKRAEARRLEDERRQRERTRAQEEARRKEEAQKKEEMLRKEIRGRLRAGISEAQAQAAPTGPPGISAAEEDARRAEEEKRREEERRKEERRRRWQELQKKHEVDTIEDVLSKIGIK